MLPVVSAAVFQSTVTSHPDAASKLIVNDTAVPSVAAASAIDSTGGSSSSVIVPVAVAAVGDTTPLGADSWTRNVSSGSSRASSLVATVTVVEVDPAAMITSVRACAV